MNLYPNSLKTWHCAVILFLAVFGAYLNALNSRLVDFDDTMILRGFSTTEARHDRLWDMNLNLSRAPLHAISDIVTGRNLTGFSFALDEAVFGQDLWGFHLMNVLYHFGAACLAFLIASELLDSNAGGLAAALAFSLHPLQTEAVAYLAGRRDVLCGIFSLASFYLWLLGRKREKPRWLLYAGMLWGCALAAKTAAITLPLICIAHDKLRGPRINLPASFRNRLILGCVILLCGIVLLLHLHAEKTYAAEFHLPREALWYGGTPARQWATEPRILLHGLRLLLWPKTLSGDYSYRVFEPAGSFLEPLNLFFLFALAGIVWLAWRARQKKPLAVFSLLWLALAYIPMLPVLPARHNKEVFAEHWLYLPVFGMALLAAQLFLYIRRRNHRLAWACLAATLALAAGRTIVRNRDWRDALTFWSKTSRTFPQCARALEALGNAYFSKDRWDLAEPLYRRAIEIDPKNPGYYVDLSLLYYYGGRPTDAEDMLLQARRLPLGRADFLALINENLGMIYLQSGQIVKALHAFKNARGGGIGIPEAVDGAAYCWFLLGDYAQAERLYQDVLGLHPAFVSSLNNLGLLYLKQERFRQARPYFEKALTLDPDRLDARVNLGLTYAALGEFVPAHINLTAAVRNDPHSPNAWIALSYLHRRCGMLPQALAAARRAVALDNSPDAYQELSEVMSSMRNMKKTKKAPACDFKLQKPGPREEIPGFAANFY